MKNDNSKLERFSRKAPQKYNLYFDKDECLYRPSEDNAEYDIFMRIMSEPISRISTGEKMYELRKYVPLHKKLFFMYETDNIQAVTGCFYCEDVIVKPVKDLWEFVGEKATLKEKFDKYFEGKEFGVALSIADYQFFEHPITKKELFLHFPKFPKPPEPYVYLYTKTGSPFSRFLRKGAAEIIKRNGL
jgi:predicted transcriptional regulator